MQFSKHINNSAGLLCMYINLLVNAQVNNIVPAVQTGEYVVRKFAGQPQEPFVYSTLKAQRDMDTDGGGWLVIQRRVPNGRVNFTRDWEDYEKRPTWRVLVWAEKHPPPHNSR